VYGEETRRGGGVELSEVSSLFRADAWSRYFLSPYLGRQHLAGTVAFGAGGLVDIEETQCRVWAAQEGVVSTKNSRRCSTLSGSPWSSPRWRARHLR